MSRFLRVLSCGVSTVLAVSVDAQVTYEVIDLGPLPGGTETVDQLHIEAINERGEVVGWFTDVSADRTRPFIWLPAPRLGLTAGEIHPLGQASEDSKAFGLNDHGVAVGSIQLAPAEFVAAAFYPHGGEEIIGIGAEARDVNNAGYVVGISDDPQECDDTFGFLYTLSGACGAGRRLGPAAPHSRARAYAINDWFQIAGHSDDGDSNALCGSPLCQTGAPTFWSSGPPCLIGRPVTLSLPATGPADDDGGLRDLNDLILPEFVGFIGSSDGVCDRRAAAWMLFARFELEDACGEVPVGNSEALAVNDGRDIVGYAGAGAAVWHYDAACLAGADRIPWRYGLLEAMTAGKYQFYEATDINDRGWITVRGRRIDNDEPTSWAFILRPVR